MEGFRIIDTDTSACNSSTKPKHEMMSGASPGVKAFCAMDTDQSGEVSLQLLLWTSPLSPSTLHAAVTSPLHPHSVCSRMLPPLALLRSCSLAPLQVTYDEFVEFCRTQMDPASGMRKIITLSLLFQHTLQQHTSSAVASLMMTGPVSNASAMFPDHFQYA